jgi:uncharacterized membrane protein HdeD (DUF308 family)
MNPLSITFPRLAVQVISEVLLAGTPFLAQSVSELRDKVGEVLDIIMLFAFLFGVVLIISGAMQIRHGDHHGGKWAIIAGAIIAAAPLIMKILFAIFEPNSAIPFR